MRSIIIIVVLVLLVSALLFWQFGLTRRDRKLFFSTPVTISVGEDNREFYVNAPDNRKPPSALYIGFHGFGDSPQKFGYYTGLHNAIDAQDIVIYPKAVEPNDDQRSGWNAGYCCGSGWMQKSDDTAFISKIAENFKAEYGEDTPVYLVGFSNGGMMVQRLIAENPRLFAGAAVSGSSAGVTGGKILSPETSSARLLLMHGEMDMTVKFSGGATNDEPDFPWLSFQETTEIWQEAIGSGLSIKTYPKLEHQWPDWRIFNFWHTHPEGSKRAVEFLTR